jgi:hypothetical protein
VGRALHAAHACTRQHWERDNRDLPKVDRIDATNSRARTDTGLRCTKADRQTVDGAGAQQREQLTPTYHIENQTPARKKTAVIFAQFEPDADRLGWVVLKQHRNAPEAPRRKRVGKGSAHDHVTRLIDFAEQAGVAFDGAVSIDGCSRGKTEATVGSDKGASIEILKTKKPPLAGAANINVTRGTIRSSDCDFRRARPCRPCPANNSLKRASSRTKSSNRRLAAVSSRKANQVSALAERP